MVREHSKTIAGTSKIALTLIRTLPTAEDPQTDFTEPLTMTPITLSASNNSKLQSVALPANAGPMVSLVLTADQLGALGANLIATISVVLSLKN